MSRLIDRLNGVGLAGEIVRSRDPRPPVPRVAPHPLPPSQAESLSTVLDILQRRKLTILGFVSVVVLLVAGASFVIRPKYEAVSRIVFNRENTNPLGFKDLGDTPRDDSEYTVSLDTQMQILQSETLAAQVISNLRLDQNPMFVGKKTSNQQSSTASSGFEANARKAQAGLVRRFMAGMAVAKEKNTRVIDIRYKSTDPKLSADIANAVTQAYIEHNFRMRFQSTTQTSSWLTQQLGELATKVQESQQKVVDYQKKNGFLELDEKQNVVTTRLDDLNRELTAAQSDRISKEANYRLTLAGNAELTVKAEPNALIDKLNTQEANLRTAYAQATVQLGPSNPKVQELSNQIKETQQQIESELSKMSARAQAQFSEAEVREKMLRVAVEEQKEQANKLSETSIEYSLLKRDAESNRALYEGLLQKLKEAGVSAGMRSSNIEVVDVAEVPALPVEPNILRNLMVATFLGIVGGIGLAFVQERIDQTVRSVEQIQAVSSLPQLGIIPLAPASKLQVAAGSKTDLVSSTAGDSPVDLVVISNPVSPIAESYRGLVNSILLSEELPPKVILVTSAVMGDGKTATSINVALVLAKQGKRVLLVDADLRRPSIDKIMQLKCTAGLSTILRSRDNHSTMRSGARSEASPLSAHGVSNLFVMPAGPASSESSELIGSKTMHDLLDEWKVQFDHIIIDSPPVGLVADTVRLSVLADSVVLVVRWGHTPQGPFVHAQQLLTQVNAPVMGVVFNGADFSSPAFSYYRQYGYYSYSR